MKNWVDKHLEGSGGRLVVDLESCTGMDSTFMGTLAGFAMKLAKVKGGKMEVVSASEKSERSLDDLGLSSLMEITKGEGEFEGRVDGIRSELSEPKAAGTSDRTQHVFDAHKTLCEADDDNNDKFSTVLDCLEAELAERKSSS